MNRLDLEKKPFISAVIYLRNNESEIESFTRGIMQQLSTTFENFELIFVNDYCTDNTLDYLPEALSGYEGLTASIIHLSYFHGLESAMLAGMDIAIGDFIYEFDSVYQDYNFSEIVEIYRQALQGNDIVSASPEGKDKLTSKLFYYLFKKYSKNKIELQSERFRILSRRAVNRINILTSYIPYRKAVYFHCGLKAINYNYKPTKHTDYPDYLHSTNRQNVAITSLLLFTDIGTKAAILMALLFLSLSIFMAFYTICAYLILNRIAPGWTTLMLFSSISFTGVFVLFAIIIKYTSLILELQRTKQTYVYESIQKLK